MHRKAESIRIPDCCRIRSRVRFRDATFFRGIIRWIYIKDRPRAYTMDLNLGFVVVQAK